MRTDLLALAVWQAVYALLAHPERLAAEYRRRVPPDTRAKRTPLAPIEGPQSTLRQGLVRLMDRDAEGLLGQSAFAPRLTRLRQRIAHLATQGQ